MDESDMYSLLKVAKFTSLPSKDQKMFIDQVIKNINSRIEASKKSRDEVVRKIANLMVERKYNLQQVI